MNIKKIAVNNWVTSQNKVGKIVSEGEKGEFWVLWSGDSLPMNESAKSLQIADYEGEDLAGKTFKEGRCNRLFYVGAQGLAPVHGVQAEVYLEHKKKPQIWSLEKLANKLKEENPPFDKPIMLPISQIRRDGGTQPRASLNHETIMEYAEDMKNGDNFPPVTVFYNGSEHWLADGFHRVEAGIAAGLTEIAAIVKQGTRRDAVLYSVGANAKHGLRRTNADKRRAVMRLLEDQEWSRWSDPAGICFAVRKIAKITSTSHPLVAKIRSGLTGNFSSDNLNSDSSNLTGNFSSDNPSERTYVTKHGTQAKMNTANIGKGKQTDSSPLAEDEVVIPDSEQINEDLDCCDLPEGFPNQVSSVVK